MSISRSPKAQAATEFMLVTAFMFIIFTGLFLVLSNVMISYQSQQDQKDVEAFADSLRSELVLAAGVADGYNRTVVLPSELIGYPYTVVMMSPAELNFTELVVGVPNVSQDVIISLPPNITGNFSPGINYISKQWGIVNVTHP